MDIKQSQIDLINALSLIQEVCKSNKDCNQCPLFGHATCMLEYCYPSNWDINKPDEIWRALK